MRRLILEIDEKQLTKVGLAFNWLRKIKSIDVLHFLRQDHAEVSTVSRIEFYEEPHDWEDLNAGGLVVKSDILEQVDNKTLIIFSMFGKQLYPIMDTFGITEGYLLPPLGFRDGKLKISFIGNEETITKFLEKMDNYGVKYHVILMTNANFRSDSPLSNLTEKQRDAITAAFKLGYYDIPRQMNSARIAEALNMGNSTLGEHLRKAEKRLLKEILIEA